MSRLLRKNFFVFIILFVACNPAHRSASTSNALNDQSATLSQTLPSELVRIDSTRQNDSTTKPLSLMDLPQTENGQIVLSEGFYEADFKSYCLQPGTPSPAYGDAYREAPLTGYRRDIIETILRNSLKNPELEQRNIQLLVWSVVSGSDFRKLPWEVQTTAQQLLSRKQIFELKGGVIGIAKTVSEALPAAGVTGANLKLKQLFALGASSYELYERVAVADQSLKMKNGAANKDQWYKQSDGYYLRYFPGSYQHVKVQVYVPEGTLAGKDPGDYLLFDPVTMMAIPTNSNSQRLGIGAPVIDVVRKIIQIQQTPGNPKKPPVQPSNPKTQSNPKTPSNPKTGPVN
jgi:hypothetical protein